MMSKVVVFGGNGFVGTRVLKYLCEQSINAVSVSRSGRPKHLQNEAWANKVEWLRGDAMIAKSYSDVLSDVSAVVISVGSPPIPVADESWQIMANGG